MATVALAGNPNTGKSTIFNALTGMAQHVGNYPGVTVEKVVGRLDLGGLEAELLDLPGCYSMSAHSPDEGVVVDVLFGHTPGFPSPDLIVVVLDASNPERNLYLLSQLLEARFPIVVALNMIDVAASRGMSMNVPALATRLGVPVVPVQGRSGRGLERLKAEIRRALDPGNASAPRPPDIDYPLHFHRAQERVYLLLREREAELGRRVARAEVLRALVDMEGHSERRLVERLGSGLAEDLKAIRKDVQKQAPLCALEAQARYAWVRKVLEGIFTRPDRDRPTATDRIDAVVTHPVLGTAVLVLVLATMFQAVYAWSVPVMDLIESVFGRVGEALGALLPPGALQSLIQDGLVAGVGGVLVFLPQILVLFLFIAMLEDCGYMARAAFLLDRVMARAGLSGKSFIPLLSSFACAVPGIMATRTIEDRRDRLATILVAPLMTCSARLPIYTVLIAAFVPATGFLGGWIGLQALTLLALYLLGIVVAILAASIFKRTILRGQAPPFMLELPSYKWPVPKVVLRRMVHQGWAFVRRAGTVILMTTVLVWALGYFPRPADPEKLGSAEHLDGSYLGQAGRTLEPAFEPLGWDWRIGVAAIASFPAREVVVATLGTIFNLGAAASDDSTDLRRALTDARRPDGSPLFGLPVALSLMVFFALCCQCSSTLAIIRRETGSWRWPAFTFAYMTLLAYVAALLTYQLGVAFSG